MGTKDITGNRSGKQGVVEIDMGSLGKQVVRPVAVRLKEAVRYREHPFAFRHCRAGGADAAALYPCLHDKQRIAPGGKQVVAFDESKRQRLFPIGIGSDHRPVADDPFHKLRMCRGLGRMQATWEECIGGAPQCEGCLMGQRIDTEGETGGNDLPLCHRLTHRLPGDSSPIRGTAAAPDDPDLGNFGLGELSAVVEYQGDLRIVCVYVAVVEIGTAEGLDMVLFMCPQDRFGLPEVPPRPQWGESVRVVTVRHACHGILAVAGQHFGNIAATGVEHLFRIAQELKKGAFGPQWDSPQFVEPYPVDRL